MQIANVFYGGEERLAVYHAESWMIVPKTWHGLTMSTTDDFLLHQSTSSFSVPDLLEAAVPVKSGEWTWRPALTRPEKIFCIGLNYKQHALESGMPLPTSPVVFSKFSNTLAAHEEGVPIPEASSQVDYEAELAMVIGRVTHNVSVDEALQSVWGYTIANDISARDLQTKTSQWLLGKSCDKFLPLGPVVTSADAIPDPNRLAIDLWLNGENRQHSNTRDMIFSCAEIVSYLSKVWTLKPGDVICTGTPQGVILGRPEGQRDWLKAGDVVRLRIEGLGEQLSHFV
ncbi:MAG: 5-carboxymethyl-2-hydroxymuconate isomerase [Sulfobacillus thermosulfidooxidans]|nr:MAG: 5-carboxymethyl-2-hydroxymuconate isomerase [Sulfobacillus thermosulfidooxidans]